MELLDANRSIVAVIDLQGKLMDMVVRPRLVIDATDGTPLGVAVVKQDAAVLSRLLGGAGDDIVIGVDFDLHATNSAPGSASDLQCQDLRGPTCLPAAGPSSPGLRKGMSFRALVRHFRWEGMRLGACRSVARHSFWGA